MSRRWTWQKHRRWLVCPCAPSPTVPVVYMLMLMFISKTVLSNSLYHIMPGGKRDFAPLDLENWWSQGRKVSGPVPPHSVGRGLVLYCVWRLPGPTAIYTNLQKFIKFSGTSSLPPYNRASTKHQNITYHACSCPELFPHSFNFSGR